MDFAGRTDCGPRPLNEDNFFCYDLTRLGRFTQKFVAFIMVSDGMGGHEAGDVASRLAVQAAEGYLEKLKQMASVTGALDLDASMALDEIVTAANNAISRESAARGTASMGATFVAAFISPGKAWIGHVGDSRAYLIREGVATQLTTDHSQVGRLLSRGVITEKEAQTHPDRNKIERALGFTSDAPEITEVPLERRDLLLLCSDGVSTVVTGKEMAACIGKARTLQGAADGIIATALRNGTDDNATVVLCGALLRKATPDSTSTRSGTLSEKDGVKVVDGVRSSVPRSAAGVRGKHAKAFSAWVPVVATGVVALLLGFLCGMTFLGNAINGFKPIEALAAEISAVQAEAGFALLPGNTR
ncbi:MAG: protein phosphatase 2C domain-containing protein [Coriobacteriia bacterium]|nr:protein phosphatase 2C domain-containing protein [Coriobacteriia bacterium]